MVYLEISSPVYQTYHKITPLYSHFYFVFRVFFKRLPCCEAGVVTRNYVFLMSKTSLLKSFKILWPGLWVCLCPIYVIYFSLLSSLSLWLIVLSHKYRHTRLLFSCFLRIRYFKITLFFFYKNNFIRTRASYLTKS